MIACAKYSILLVEGLLFVLAARIDLEVLQVNWGLPHPLAALAEIAWVVALCVTTWAWHRQGAPKHSWIAYLRAAVVATGIAPLYMGSALYLGIDRHAAALVTLSSAGIFCLAEYAALRLRHLEEQQSLAAPAPQRMD